MTSLSHGDAEDLLARLRGAVQGRDVDAGVALYARDGDVRPDPFGEHISGDLAIRAWWNAMAAGRANVEFDVERSWAVGRTVLASWHGAWTRRDTAERIRARGFLILEVGNDGLIVRERRWTLEQAVGQDGTVEPEPEGSLDGR